MPFAELPQPTTKHIRYNISVKTTT